MQKWTEAEDHIIKTRTLVEARTLLPNRTNDAVKGRRIQLKVTIKRGASRKWSKREQSKLRKHIDKSIAELRKRLPGRSAEAIKSMKKFMLPDWISKSRPWTAREWSLLKRMWPSATKDELRAAFPERTMIAIIAAAEKTGVSRKPLRSEAASDLLQEVRRRCFEDKISITTLPIQLGLPKFFLRETKNKNPDMNRLKKVVEFFGGRFVIDWQDE